MFKCYLWNHRLNKAVHSGVGLIINHFLSRDVYCIVATDNTVSNDQAQTHFVTFLYIFLLEICRIM